MIVTYDPIGHVYRVNGRRCVSVTSVLKRAGYVDARFYTEPARRRGTAVHHATHLIDRKRGYDESYGEARAYQKFVTDYRPKYIEIETVLSDGHVCGRVDRIFGATGPGAFVGPGILEIKTGACMPWHGYQTAGYAYLADRDLGLTVMSRWCLHLRPSGTYQLRQHTSSIDRAKFLRAVADFGQESDS